MKANMPRLNLVPLQEWVCDTCGDVIEKPEHGYVEWKCGTKHREEHYGFRIVHHALYSPYREAGRDCYYSNAERGGDRPLTDFLGERGVVLLTSMIDPGAEFDEDFKGPYVRDLREWTVLFRRVQVSLYEEARLYFKKAHRDGNLGGANEVYFYLPDNGLREILREYSEDD